ncbi:hypothetical protein Dcar01_01434 [Deinococcus carri]|uniref:Novel STAND NTPase 6 domain-containing protein n=1 Tax=Deinococcus carri TaxID=1211323 RepID=A0ABP9W5T1_9DEIO
MTSPPVLSLHLLGAPRLLWQGQAVALAGKALLLLARLALEGRHEREALAALLWPELPPGDARNNLRVSLSGLRRKLPGVLLTDRSSVACVPLWTDVQALEQAAAAGQAEEVRGLWQGPFLAGVALPGGELAAWVRARRGSLAALHARFRGPAAPPEVSPAAAPRPRLLGRELDLHALNARLAQHPLVTLHGLGGVGKTALVRELVARWPVAQGPALALDLTGCRTAPEVYARLGQALDLGGVSDLPQLALHLRAWPGLLVLDGADHLEGGAEVVAELRRALPEHRLLLVRQRPLGLPGEALSHLRPLPVPPRDAWGQRWNELLAYPAAALFVDRAQGVRPGLPHDGPAVAAICEALDGLPLALEWAAAHTAVLAPAALLEQLREPGRLLLRSVAAAHPPHHRDLGSLMRHNLAGLPDPARELLRWLGVLEGPARLDELALLLERPAGELLPELETLWAASLLHVTELDGQGCFGVPRLVRAYLTHVLPPPPGAELRRLRLVAGAVQGLTADLRSERHGHAQAQLRRLEPDIRQALDWAARQPPAESPEVPDLARRLLDELTWWWLLRGQGQVALDRRAQFSPGPDAPANGERRWRVAGGLAVPSAWVRALAHLRTALRHEEAGARARHLRAAHRLFSEQGDPWGMALCALEARAQQGERRDLASLRARVDESRELGQPWLLGQELYALCAWLLEQGQAAAALPLLGEQLRTWEECGWCWGEELALFQMAEVAWHLGQRPLACRLYGLTLVRGRACQPRAPSRLLAAIDRRLEHLPGQLRSAAERQAWREGQRVPPGECAGEARRLWRELELGGVESEPPGPRVR